VEAINQVYQGNEFIDPVIKEQLVHNMLKLKKNAPVNQEPPVLTQREKDILKLIMAEYTSQEIADKLFLSLRTIENQRFVLLQKLEAKNTVGLLKIALRMGLLE
jgi:DNA-binding NarL/FixJ family response regulator